MKLDLNDPGISTDLAIYGVREPLMTEYYQRELKKIAAEKQKPIVADVGANVGYYAFMPLALDDSFEVLAIEVEKNNYRQLQENVELNGYEKRITCVNKGVGSGSGEGNLQISDQSNLHTIEKSVKHDGKYKNTETVSIETLPTICQKNGYSMEDIDVLRMDTEGYEYNILEGIPDLNAGDGLLINLEIHPTLLGDTGSKIIDRLEDANADLIAATWKGKEVKIDQLSDVLDYRWLTLLINVPGR